MQAYSLVSTHRIYSEIPEPECIINAQWFETDTIELLCVTQSQVLTYSQVFVGKNTAEHTDTS